MLHQWHFQWGKWIMDYGIFRLGPTLSNIRTLSNSRDVTSHKGRSSNFFPASRLRFGWVTSLLSLFLVTKNVASHFCQVSWKKVTLSHMKIFFLNGDVFGHILPETSLFGPAGTKLFWTARNVTIRLGLKSVFLFQSQICHLSRKS